MKRGRPTKYREEYCEIAEAILSQDNPMCVVAKMLKVNTNTLRAWRRRYPDFYSACERGRDAGKALFLEKVARAAWDPVNNPVNNSLVCLLAYNKYGMVGSRGSSKQQRSETPNLADAVRLRHEKLSSPVA